MNLCDGFVCLPCSPGCRNFVASDLIGFGPLPWTELVALKYKSTDSCNQLNLVQTPPLRLTNQGWVKMQQLCPR